MSRRLSALVHYGQSRALLNHIIIIIIIMADISHTRRVLMHVFCIRGSNKHLKYSYLYIYIQSLQETVHYTCRIKTYKD